MEVTIQQIQEVEIIRRYLINQIRSTDKRYFTTYQKMVDDCKLPYPDLKKNPLFRKQLGVLLAYLLVDNTRNGQPILTSIVYGVGLYRPRNGFYITLCRENPLKANFRLPEEVFKDIIFRRKIELEAVTFWRNDKNINSI